MKQALWIINSSIVFLLIFSLAILQILYQEPPIITKLAVPLGQGESKKKTLFPVSRWEPIYKKDLFETYAAQLPQPSQKNLVTPTPEIQEPEAQKPLEPKAPEFLPELVLSIKGIIIAADETQNVAMIEDEAKKEGVFHVGDMYKDGQVIKISRNSVVFLRASGQQEAFYLRKEDADLAMDGPTKWEFIVKKLDDSSWQIDPESFKHEIDSLGLFLDKMNILGTAYQQGNPLGIRIGSVEKGSLAELLGFKNNDIILSINNVSTAQAANRVAIFDKIATNKPGDVIIVKIKRSEGDVSHSYKLNYISKAKRILFGDEKPKEDVKPQEGLKMSPVQEREKQIRDFNARHENAQQQDAIAQIRKRLLENLRNRLQNGRNR